jgi:hypothetical protein
MPAEPTRATPPPRARSGILIGSMGKAGIAGAESVVEELLALPPERFTEARNAAVKQLRAEGRRDAADAVKGIPRPPLALWALNRLAREHPDLLETFLAAADELREAYRSGGDIRAATPPERAAEARIVTAATELLRAQGKSATDTVVRSLGQTLRAAAADAEIADELRSGRLIREPAAPSIDDLLGSMPDAPAKARAGTAKATPRHDRDAERVALREQVLAATSEATRAREEARAASRAASEARAEWKRAEKLATRATALSDAAGERLRDLEQALEAL